MFVVEHSKILDYEKDFCDQYICEDNKNIHAWNYRVWFVEKYGKWDNELEYAESSILSMGFLLEFINIDVYNNSAWSYRFFVFKYLFSLNSDATQSQTLLDNELTFVMDKLHFAPHNDAAWNYLQGLIDNYKNYCYDNIIFEIEKLVVGFVFL